MKPERIQMRAVLEERAGSFASRVCDLLDWIEIGAAALKRLFGRGSDHQ